MAVRWNKETQKHETYTIMSEAYYYNAINIVEHIGQVLEGTDIANTEMVVKLLKRVYNTLRDVGLNADIVEVI